MTNTTMITTISIMVAEVIATPNVRDCCSDYLTETQKVGLTHLTEAFSGSACQLNSRQRSDDFAVFLFGKSLHGFRRNVSELSRR